MVATRDRILRAATELFADQGYAGTSMRQVAERAEANSALIYYYFGTKRDLFEAALGPPAAELLELLERAYTMRAPASRRLEVFVREYVPLALRGLPHTALVLKALASGDPEMREMMRRELAPNAELLARIVEEGIASGEFRPVDPRLAVGSLVGMILPYALTGSLAAPLLGLEVDDGFAARLTEHTLRVFLAGVRA